jgi:hypothetical protein
LSETTKIYTVCKKRPITALVQSVDNWSAAAQPALAMLAEQLSQHNLFRVDIKE